jgi:hypothetical protein
MRTTMYRLADACSGRDGTIRRALCRLLALALSCGSLAVAAGDKARPLFASSDPVAISLQAPWAEVTRRSNAEQPVRHAAVLSYVDATGAEHRIDATVETRGVTRKRVCRFPPLRLRFTKAAVQGTLFEGQRSLKMVTHCMQGPQFEQYYVQELLAYRIYNLITDRSFRARPLEVTYLAPGKKPERPKFAFLIEDLEDVQRRSGLEHVAQPRFEPDAFDPLALSRFALFQLLIGNTDWEVLSGPDPAACCHNVRVGLPKEGGALVALPYDFDSSGMVDASYAAPHERLPIKDVKQRLFRGFCAHNDVLEVARQEFLGHRPAILALVHGESRLGTTRREAVTRYVGGFYEMLGNPVRFEREIKAKCRK